MTRQIINIIILSNDKTYKPTNKYKFRISLFVIMPENSQSKLREIEEGTHTLKPTKKHLPNNSTVLTTQVTVIRP